MTLRNAAIAAILLSCSQQALSWGQTGHRVTGKIAEFHLTSDAKAMVDAILGNETLAEASTYADEMRSNPADYWQNVAGPFHYVTVPKDKSYTDVGEPEQGDSYSALASFTKTLSSPTSSLEDKQLALRFAVHIIGDLHQPLHAGNGNDRGGNDVKVEFFWENSNLHRVWDSGMIDKQQLSFTEWANWLNAKITEQHVSEWKTTDPLVYIAESTEIRDTIYPEDTKLSWQYQYEHLPTVKRRLQQAGIRIASYLNDIAMKTKAE